MTASDNGAVRACTPTFVAGNVIDLGGMIASDEDSANFTRLFSSS